MTDKIISKETVEAMRKFYIEIAQIAGKLDPNANSINETRQILISNVLKIYQEVC